MIIDHGQQICFAAQYPGLAFERLAFGAVAVAARIVRHTQLPTARAGIHMSAQQGRPALPQIGQRLLLPRSDLPTLPQLFAKLGYHVRHLPRRAAHFRSR